MRRDERVSIPPALLKEARPLLKERGLTLNEWAVTALTSFVNAQPKCYKLADKFKGGKYRGAIVEHVVRTEPGYIRWTVDNVDSIGFHAEVLELLAEMEDATP